jgi:hypothetical protein
VTTGLPRPAECNACADPIRFVNLDTGKAMPVNPAPGPDGNVAARMRGGRLVGFVITAARRPGPLDRYRFTPHYATCEAVDRTPKPAPDPALF